MLTCRDATALVSESMDHRLPTRRRWSLRFHLLMCRYCSRFARQLRFVQTAARRAGGAEGAAAPGAAPGLSPGVAQRLSDDARQRLSDTVRLAAGAPPAPPSDEPFDPVREE